MKKTTFILLLTVLLSIQNTQRTYAQMSVVDWPGIGEFIVAQGTRLGQFAKESITSASNMVGDAASQFNNIQQNFIRPAQDLLMIASVAKSSNQIKTLVLGGVGGETSLLITNPELYIKQKGVESMKIQAGQVAKADGIYSKSILNSIVTTARINSDTAGRLAALSKSSIPKTVQDDLCQDTKLESVAINDVTKSDGTYDVTTMKNRKKEIYSKLCVGDPNTDKTLAQALTTAGNQTGAGGWGAWLALTSGDNEGEKTRLAAAIVEQEKQAREAAKAADLTRGSGVISKTECLLKVPNTVTGEPDCMDEAITQSGAQLNAALRSAISAPLEVLKNTIGTGAGGFGSSIISSLGNVAALLGSINNIRTSLNGMSNSVNTITGNSPGIGGDPRLQITLAGQKSPGTVTTVYSSTASSGNTAGTTNAPVGNTTPVQDLFGAPANTKNQLTNPILNQLNQHADALATLKTTDSSYLNAIAEYSGYIESIGSCYTRLTTDFGPLTIPPVTSPGYYAGITFPSITNDPTNGPIIADALSYYNSKKTSTDTLKNTITTEFSLVDQTITLIRNTILTIKNSNSTQEISDAFENYSNLVRNNNLPTAISGATRSGEVMEYKSNTAIDIRDFTGLAGGNNYTGKIAQLKNQCAAIRTAEQTKRDTEKKKYDDARSSSGGSGGGI